MVPLLTPQYLAAGYPIGSGVVEGVCRYLEKDRLERTGMPWRPGGAQAMLDLHVTYLNEEWESFWTYLVKQEDEGVIQRTPEDWVKVIRYYAQIDKPF